MKAVNTLIIYTDEVRKDKLTHDIDLLCKNIITSIKYDQEVDIKEGQFDILVVDFGQTIIKDIALILIDLIQLIKNIEPSIISIITGKYSTVIKNKLKNTIDVFSGVTIVKIKKDYRRCIDLMISKKQKLNYYLTDFFAPHLVGDIERKGFELVLNETYERETYQEDFLDLWRSFMFVAPLLKEENKELLKTSLHTYVERNLTEEEKDLIQREFFFQFNSLYALQNFNERRLYYMEKSTIEYVWNSVITFARNIDNSLLFGCYKSINIIRLKIMIHQSYPLKKITKNSSVYKTLMIIEPYADVIITSNGEQIVIGSQSQLEYSDIGITPIDQEYLTFDFYFKVILPQRRRRGLKRF